MSREIMTYSTYQDKKGNTLMIQRVGETFIAVKVYRQNLRVRRMGSINICETAQECQEKGTEWKCGVVVDEDTADAFLLS